MRFELLRQSAIALCLCVLSQGASATLITFDDVSACCAYPNLSYNESGYVFTLAGGDESPTGWHVGDGTSIPETLNWHGTPGGFNSKLAIVLTKEDGGLFDLLQLDIDVTLVNGFYAILGASAPGYAEETFDRTVDDQQVDFLGVSQVVFRHIQGAGVGIDNVLVRPAVKAPEPGVLDLLLTGLFGLAIVGITRFRRAAHDQRRRRSSRGM